METGILLVVLGQLEISTLFLHHIIHVRIEGSRNDL